jgi:protein arginine kinase
MNWYCEPGKENDVVLSTRVRISRKFSDMPFMYKAKEKDLYEVTDRLNKLLPKLNYGLKLQKLKDMDLITKQSLVEKKLITSEFIENNSDAQAIAINDEENICIMINETDHMQVQVFNSGLDLDNCMNLVNEIDGKINSAENIAFDNKLGFLTSDITNVGTGLKASIMVHLPGLIKTGNIQKIFDFVEKLGMNIKLEDENINRHDCDIYKISSRQTLGISEKDTIENLKLIARTIVEQERVARKFLAKNSSILEDTVYRSFGILVYARRLKYDEANKFISDIKLGVDLGIITELNDSKIKKMLLYIKPANMQKMLGNTLSKEEMEFERAKIIQNIIKEN